MKRVARLVSGFVIAAAVTAGVAALSLVPYTAQSDIEALVRLSWQVRGERFEECRPLTDQERARLPAHMQRDEVCEGRVLPYLLTVRLNEAAVLRDTIHAPGARGDRPLSVFAEFARPAGPVTIDVRFERIGDVRSMLAMAPPPVMAIDTSLTVSPRGIVLVTYDETARALVVRASPELVSP